MRIRQYAKKFSAIFLALCLILAMGAISATAAGPGYSDIFRLYTLSGVNGNPSVDAIGIMYGSANNKPADNYVTVVKVNQKAQNMLMDVMNGDQFNKMVQSAISSSQTDTSKLNQALLANGVSDRMLVMGEKPEVVTKIEKAVADKKGSVTIVNNDVILPDALKLAAQTGGKDFRIHFDCGLDNAVLVRMTVNPSQATKGFATAALPEGSDFTVIESLSKYYTNKFVAVDFLQGGSFGTNIQVAALVDLSGMDTSHLYFASYDAVENTMVTIDAPNYSVDAKGYLHFTTNVGGTILISDKPITKR